MKLNIVRNFPSAFPPIFFGVLSLNVRLTFSQNLGVSYAFPRCNNLHFSSDSPRG